MFSPNIALFAYDFPHWKSENILLDLLKKDLSVKAVIAAPKLDLLTNVEVEAPPATRLKALCEFHDVSYLRVSHDDLAGFQQLIEETSCNLAIIAGARKIAPEVIRAFKYGIVNYHPGLLPETAGLNAVERAILLDIPVSVTAHLINEKLDDGQRLFAIRVPVFPEDTMRDIKERCLRFQVYINESVISGYSTGAIFPQAVGRKLYNKKLDGHQIAEVDALFPAWRAKYCTFEE